MDDSSYRRDPVLLVDDEERVLLSYATILQSAGFPNVLTCSDGRDVESVLADHNVEAILLDLTLPHLPGEQLLTLLREQHPDIPVVVVTANDDVATAVRCMQAGAVDYMVKPVEKTRLLAGLRQAIRVRRLERNYDDLKDHMLSDRLRIPDAFADIKTRNRKIHNIFLFAESIAQTDETVLISGETGVGKELLARAMHRVSRPDSPFVIVDTAGLDDTMISDTLFGHHRGAFTGATEPRRGLIHEAGDGTLVLDEIGDLSLPNQVKLLRVVERREFYPLGSDKVSTTRARFILCTNRDLRSATASGAFRKDLYYRISSHEINLPPLRERKDDIPLLLDFFLDEACLRLSQTRLAVPSQLEALLASYHFPGNVRELRSMVFDAVSKQHTGTLSLGPFRTAMGRDAGELERRGWNDPDQSLSFGESLPTLKQAAECVIQEALRRAEGNQAIAAGILGISPQALSKRLSRLRRNLGSDSA